MADAANATGKSVPKGMLEGLDTFDLIRSGALIVMFCSITFKDRRTWLWADSIAAVLIGLFDFFRPDVILRQISNQDDDELQFHIVQAFAACMVADGVYRYFARQSKDETVISSLIWSRFMSGVVMTVVAFYTHYSPKSVFRPEHVSFVMLAHCMWTVSGAVQLWRYVNPMGGVEKSGPVVWLLRLDFFNLFLAGLVYLAFPGWLLSFQIRMGKIIHRYLMRILGALILGVALQGQQTTSFRYDSDRTAFLLSRVGTYLLLMALAAYNHLFEGLFNRREIMYHGCGCLLFALPSAVALFLSLTGRGGTGHTSGHRYSSSTTTYYTRSSKRAY